MLTDAFLVERELTFYLLFDVWIGVRSDDLYGMSDMSGVVWIHMYL